MLTVQNVTKIYGARKAVDNISFTLGDHGILGFLGPNGAGKSTTMNIIAGYTSSASGTVTVNGHEILDDPIGAKKNVGYLPERPPLYPDMTVKAYLSFMFDLKKIGLPKKDHIDETCASVGLTPMQNRIIKNLSKGYQQRVGLAQAMLGNPGLLILDEPTVGLDPVQILEIRSLIRELGKKSAVIFSSHILQEVQAVADRIIVINNGVLIADDTLENLSRATGNDNRLLLTVEGDPNGDADGLQKFFREIPGLKSAELLGNAEEPGAFEFALENEDGKDIRRELFRRLAEKGWPILSLRKSGMSLEDAFIRITAGDNAALSALTGAAADTSAEAVAEAAAEVSAIAGADEAGSDAAALAEAGEPGDEKKEGDE
ncbi:multidrug ABC transporter ATP-binding protein [Spirochaetia bacterium]|nr:multidrug ABC transporter ATP-binding protein [Spirochaetia bacterium]